MVRNTRARLQEVLQTKGCRIEVAARDRRVDEPPSGVRDRPADPLLPAEDACPDRPADLERRDPVPVQGPGEHRSVRAPAGVNDDLAWSYRTRPEPESQKGTAAGRRACTVRPTSPSTIRRIPSSGPAVRIAIDIDSTLHHHWPLLAAAAKRRFGVELPYEQQFPWAGRRLSEEQLRVCIEDTHSDGGVAQR